MCILLKCIERSPLFCLPCSHSTVDNGFNPVWNEGCDFNIINADLALLRFVAQDEDVFGDPNFIGQAVFPVLCLKTGFRSIPLKNAMNEELESSTLLVRIKIKHGKSEEGRLRSAIYRRTGFNCDNLIIVNASFCLISQKLEMQIHLSEITGIVHIVHVCMRGAR